MKVCFFTLGCKVNQQETAAMINIFKKAGYEVVQGDAAADVYVVNSCTVTLNGDRKSIQWIRRARRQNPEAVIALCGCMPQAFPLKAIDVEEADIIIGSKGKGEILNLVNQFKENKERHIDIVPHSERDKFEELASETDALHTRAFLKIQDGCNRECAYCIIPKARGRVRSRPVDSIVAEAKKMAAAGHKEIVLTGVNISCYGQDLGNNVCDAIEAVAEIEDVKRVRLGSLELDLFTDEMLVRMSKVKKFCPHFHLSLQSGSDKTLKNMNRLYDTQLYTDMMNRLRELFDKPSFTTDIIVGFPGETYEDFKETLSLVKEVEFSSLFTFIYSPRNNTPAALMPDPISREEKGKWFDELLRVQEEIAEKNKENYIGKTFRVLCDGKTDTDGFMKGHTNGTVSVEFEADESYLGKFVDVRIDSYKNAYMGTLLKN